MGTGDSAEVFMVTVITASRKCCISVETLLFMLSKFIGESYFVHKTNIFECQLEARQCSGF